MGWFGIGGGGKDPNNPLSEIEVPKDQQEKGQFSFL